MGFNAKLAFITCDGASGLSELSNTSSSIFFKEMGNQVTNLKLKHRYHSKLVVISM